MPCEDLDTNLVVAGKNFTTALPYERSKINLELRKDPTSKNTLDRTF